MFSLLLLIVVSIIILNWRRIFPWAMVYFIHRLAKKMSEQKSPNSTQSTQKKSPTTNENLGEYIDYEEID